MDISISTGLYYMNDYKTILDIISESGCKNIELFLNQSFIDVSPQVIKEEVAKRGMKIKSIHLPLTFIAYSRNEDEELWMNRGLKLLDVFDSELLVSHFFYTKENRDESNVENHLENITNFTKKTNKNICTENLPKSNMNTKLHNPKQLVEFLDKNDCYMTFDTTHTATYDRDIIKDYYLCKDYIRNIHLSDYKDGNEHKVIGTGNLPIKELIKILKADNYQFPITLEYDFVNPKRNDVKTEKEAIRLLRNSIEYIEDVIAGVCTTS